MYQIVVNSPLESNEVHRRLLKTNRDYRIDNQVSRSDLQQRSSRNDESALRMSVLLCPTRDAHITKLTGHWFPDWPQDDMSIYRSAIVNAYPSQLDTSELLASPISKHLNLKRDNHLWIELSQPLPIAFLPVPKREIQRHRWDWASGGDTISALFYYWPALEYARQGSRSYPVMGRYDLELISKNGLICGTYSYYHNTSVQRWAIPCGDRCEQCSHQDHTLSAEQMQEPCVTPCPRCETFLNTWRNRFRQALTLIQKQK